MNSSDVIDCLPEERQRSILELLTEQGRVVASELARKFNTSEEKAFIQENFPYCLNISIDYGIMEKAHNVYMLCVDFGWADLGSWGSLFDLANKDENENAVLKNNEAMLYECSGNVIALNNPKRLAVIQGLKDCIVAESGNVLLICKKDDEQRIKQFVADAKIKYGKEYN